MPSRGKQLQRAVAAQENFRKRPGRISRHWRTAQGRAAEKVRFRATFENGDAGTTGGSVRFRRQGGRGIEGFPGGTNLSGPTLVGEKYYQQVGDQQAEA